MESLKGKALVRRGKLHNGQAVLTITGIFIPNMPIDTYSDRDEMWSVELEVVQVKKFVSANSSGYLGSPEEFLEGKHQELGYWKPKT